jgi:RNA polymerase sigma factor (sigma-70 family)
MSIEFEKYWPKIKDGDIMAFEALFKAIYPTLCYYSSQITHDPFLSEEIVQDLLQRIWQNRDLLIITTSFKAYLLQAVRNQSIDAIRKKNSRKNSFIGLPSDYEEDIYVGYRYFKSANKAVSYPFGYGLSYTTFAYSGARISQSGNDYIATVTVKNTGKVAGKQVVELYVSAPAGKLEKPACELKAFTKTKELSPGESQIVTMKFTNYDLGSYDEDIQSWVTDGGEYSAKFGTSVDDIFANVAFTAKASTLKAHDALKPAEIINRLSLK